MSLWKPISFVLLVALLAAAMVGCTPGLNGLTTGQGSAAQPASAVKQSAPSAQTGSPAAGGITVTGTGLVSATPDIARITIGVETTGADVKQTMADNNSKMNDLMNILKAAGIADKDIQTMNFSVSVQRPAPQPLPADQAATANAISYYVSNQVQVTVRDLSKLSDILDKSVSTGANSIYGINFSFSDTSKLEDQARASAVADAKARAEKLAQLSGVTLGSVVSVQEVSGYPGPIYAADKSAYGMGGGGTPIQAGDMQVSVTLQVTYAIQ